MREPVFTGVCSAIVTPFLDSGGVHYDRFGQLIDQQIARGVDAICVCGTTGESATLSIREHIAVVEYCVRRVNRRVKVIAGAGSNDTSAAVYLSQHAQDSGADALLHVTPYYNKASQAGLIKHYEHIAQRVELPMILYNVPSRTGVSFAAETYQVLSQLPQINGVKEASGGDNEIWSFGERNYPILKKLIELRERLKDYTCQYMDEASRTGAPIMRPMFWEFPEDEQCYTLEDQYFYGADLLVAPIYEQGAVERRVYLPQGRWVLTRDGNVEDGGKWITCHAELEEYIVFAREGAKVLECFADKE